MGVLAPALVHYSWSVFLLTTARSPSSDSACTHPLRCPQLLSSHTTPCSPPLRSDSMVHSMLISLSSRPTWCHTHVFTSWFHPTRQSSPPRRPTTSHSLSLRSPTHASSQPT